MRKTIIQYPACSVHGALSYANHGLCRGQHGRNSCMYLRNGLHGRNNECRVPYLWRRGRFGGKNVENMPNQQPRVKHPSRKERNFRRTRDSDMPDTQSGVALAQLSGEGENGIAVQSAGVAIDNTNFPDANFRSIVASSFDNDNDNYLSEEDINEVKFINCANEGISDFTGISHFTALEAFYCYNNQLTSLDVSKNTALIDLDCSNNQLTSLDVSKNTALTDLTCYNNQLTSLDVSKNTALTYLDCDNNQLTSLDISNANMNIFNCRNNIYQIVVDNDRTFDLSTLPGNFDVAGQATGAVGK